MIYLPVIENSNEKFEIWKQNKKLNFGNGMENMTF